MFKITPGRVLAAATSLALTLGVAGLVPSANALLDGDINVFSNNGDDGISVIGDCNQIAPVIIGGGGSGGGSEGDFTPRGATTCTLNDTVAGIIGGGGGGSSEDDVNVFSGNGDDGVSVIGDCNQIAPVIIGGGAADDIFGGATTCTLQGFTAGILGGGEGGGGESEGAVNAFSGNGDDGVSVIGDCNQIAPVIIGGAATTCTLNDILVSVLGFSGEESVSSSDDPDGAANVFSNNGDDGISVIGDCNQIAPVIIGGAAVACTLNDIVVGGILGVSGGGSSSDDPDDGVANVFSNNGGDGVSVIGDCNQIAPVIIGGAAVTCTLNDIVGGILGSAPFGTGFFGTSFLGTF